MTVPIDRETAVRVSQRLQDIARLLDADLGEAAGKRVSFSLFVWSEGYANYVSSAAREDIIPVLLTMLDRWMKGDDQPPAHEALK